MKQGFILLVVIITMLSSVAFVRAQTCTVSWVHPDQPPLFISEGYEAGMGTVQRSMYFFIKHMPECIHESRVANIERMMAIIRQSENSCSAAFYPTPERTKFIEFSIPVRVTLSNALIIPADQLSRFKPYMNGKHEILFEDLIRNGFRIGVAKGRVYRGIIDETLRTYQGNPQIIEHPASHDSVGKLIQMMIAGRVDAIIGYPFEAQYAVKSLKIRARLISLHISGMDEYGLSYAGCSRTEKGRETIRRLNAIILKYRSTPEFMRIVEHWLDPEAVKRFRRYTAKEFGR